MSRLHALLCVLVSATALSFAHEADGLAWLGWFAIMPLFLAVLRLRGGAAFGAGCGWGALVSALCGVGWPFVAIAALAGGGYVWLAATLTRRIGFSPFVLAAGWALLEFALAPLGLGEGVLGASGPAVVANVLGFVLVGFFVAYVNALLLELVREVHRRVRAAPRHVRGHRALRLPRFVPSVFVPGGARAGAVRPRGPPSPSLG